MIAWHGNPELKTATVAALNEDLAKDRYIRGTYARHFGHEWRGCHIGCLVMASKRAVNGGALTDLVNIAESTSWHQHAEDLYGIPKPLAYLWDRTYESVELAEAPRFAVASVDAVPVGADLSLVVSHLMRDLIADPERGVWKFTAEGSAQRKAVETVGGLYARRLAGDEPGRDEWGTARAYASAAYAADAADAADAYASAYAYAAAAYAADAYAYAAYAAYAYARRGCWAWIAERIIHHTRNAPIMETANG